jgi:hypothetical protein
MELAANFRAMASPKDDTSTTFDPQLFEKMRDAVADTMRATARTIHDQLPPDDTADPDAGAPAASKPAQWGRMTSEWLDRLSEEVRQWDVRESESRLRDSITRNPGSVLLLAGAAGLVLGRLLRRA